MTEVLFRYDDAKSLEISGVCEKNKIVCLELFLDIGDIKEPADGKERMSVIETMNGHADINDIHNSIEHIIKAAEGGETIRIWYSKAPYAMCGFCRLCSMLEPYNADVSTVRLPDFVQVNDELIISHSVWGEVDSNEIKSFLKYEKKLTKQEIRSELYRWRELVNDNSPLRAVVNGRLIGVPENFYDFVLLKYVTHEPKDEMMIVGSAVGNELGISDCWYSRRIDCLIAEGIIKTAFIKAGRRYICLAV